MKSLLPVLLLLLLFLGALANSGDISPEEQKLEKALRLLKEYKTDSAETLLKQLTGDEIKKQSPRIYIRAELNLGRINGDRGDNVIALQHYQEAMKMAESTGDKESMPHILKNIGVLYVSWKKFDEAFSYYDKSEGLAREMNNEELVADCQNNKGIVYEQQKEYDKALSAYKSALELYTEKNIPGKIAMALSNIAIVYKFQKNYPESISYNLKAIAISEQQNDKWSLAATYNNIGNLYGQMKDYKTAIAYCEKSIAIAKEIDAKEIIESTYDTMAEIAEKAGDYKNAYRYRKLFSEVMNEFINTENTRQLSELNIKYESEKKQNLIHQQQFELRQKNNWLVFAGIVFLLALLAAYFIYRSHKIKQDKKWQQEVFRQQEIAARSLFAGEQQERIRIARDLHDSVGQMLSLIKMDLSSQPPNSESEKTQNLVDKTIAEVRNISHNLLPEDLNFGLYPALETLADKVSSAGAIKMQVNIAEDVRQEGFAKENELSIYRIIQEVVSNMLKHAEADSIVLNVLQQAKLIVFSIRDNGKGVDANNIENAKGIGWKNIKARVNLMGGEMKVQSEKLAGTQIEISLPVSI